MLEPDLEIGLNILALVHAGKISLNCATCTNQAQLYCSGVSPGPVMIDDDLGEFYNCPMNWITPEVLKWYDEYSYYQVFQGAAPSYFKVSRRFWEATKIYKHRYDSEVYKKSKKPEHSEADTRNSLAKLRSNFQRRKR